MTSFDKLYSDIHMIAAISYQMEVPLSFSVLIR